VNNAGEEHGGMVNRWLSVVVAAGVCLAAASAALAQGTASQVVIGGVSTPEDNRWEVVVGGVAIAPLSDSADRFALGGGGDVGAMWNFGRQMAIRVDLAAAAVSPKDEWTVKAAIPATVSANMQFGTVDFVFKAPQGPARIYVLGGAGLYRRAVSLSSTSVGHDSLCDPWWLVCETGTVPVSQITGSRSTTDFGVNVGAGVAIGRYFIEARYHFMWGPHFATTAGDVMATGKYFPVTVGARF
jgi:hypothetical protein